ncbi:MAG: KamA family radical SAM protein [Bdellovibrionales bacterium]|jgi:lysine 2,3-aminomutase|nr:KamA family radical SAM protein [Bdellovibrionales bacterium]MBT3526652.1 KamA family radical SAM protein [Bdellovibrionales bacterium]MBT7768265.1 KamA family radical SAM protein [Bdellovibrionales bacterium]
MHFSELTTLDDLAKIYPQHILERFPIAGKGPFNDMDDQQWNSWTWQQKARLTNLEGLAKVIDLTDEITNDFNDCDQLFNMAITPYYANLMDRSDPNCPIRLQGIPKKEELTVLDTDMEDPLAEERDMPVPGVTHRYPDRVLFYITHNCPVYCRHCTRKRKVADPTTTAASKQIDVGLEYISSNPQIRDVIISGGDPLSLNNKRLDYILGRLRQIPHIEVIRLGTRNLVTLPQRIDDEFLTVLQKHQPIHINTHFNHPKEMTRETLFAASKIAHSGATMGNQTVLLKGVNDDPAVMKELCHKLLLMRIRPYYIFQCDQSKGISHFRTPIQTGIKIIESLRGHTSGLAVPHYVIDAPGGGGKIPISPEYIVDEQEDKVVLRNFQREQYTYYLPKKD